MLGLEIAADHGTIVIFAGHFAIHDGAALAETVWGEADSSTDAYGRRNVLYYFEDADIDACFERLKDKVALIHPIVKQAWGQRVFRFYDPDGHAIEIGEPLATSDA